jgi:hypothetical protein
MCKHHVSNPYGYTLLHERFVATPPFFVGVALYWAGPTNGSQTAALPLQMALFVGAALYPAAPTNQICMGDWI